MDRIIVVLVLRISRRFRRNSGIVIMVFVFLYGNVTGKESGSLLLAGIKSCNQEKG